MPSAATKKAASEIAALLDTPFLRALAEPARLDVLKVLLVQGAGDVASIARELPQDRSVVSRHLQTLEDAGIVRSTWEGRRRVYALDGVAFVTRFGAIADRVRALAPACCPPTAPALVELGRKPRP